MCSSDLDEDLAWLSLRNVVTAHVLVVDQLNAYDVLVNDEVVFTSAALQAFVNRGESSTRPEPVEGRDDAPSTGSGRRLRQAQGASEEPLGASEESQDASEESQGASQQAQGTSEGDEK